MSPRPGPHEDPADDPRGPSLEDVLDALEAEVGRFTERFADALEQVHEASASGPDGGTPFGFRVDIGPDGDAQVEAVGPDAGPAAGSAREPPTDVVCGRGIVAVTAQMPEAEKGDVDVRVLHDRVEVRTDGDPGYVADVDLPTEVEPETAQATFRNGVLDVRMDPTRDPPGHQVAVR